MAILKDQTIDQSDINTLYTNANAFVTRWNNMGGSLSSLGNAPNIGAKVQPTEVNKLATHIEQIRNDRFLSAYPSWWGYSGLSVISNTTIEPFTITQNYDSVVCRNTTTYEFGNSKSPAHTYTESPYTTDSKTPTQTYTQHPVTTYSESLSGGFSKSGHSGKSSQSSGNSKSECNYYSAKSTHGQDGDSKVTNSAAGNNKTSASGNHQTPHSDGYSKTTYSQGTAIDVTNSKTVTSVETD